MVDDSAEEVINIKDDSENNVTSELVVVIIESDNILERKVGKLKAELKIKHCAIKAGRNNFRRI